MMNWFPFFRSSSAPANPGKRSVPRDASEWWHEGEIAEDAGEWARAVVCYRRALVLAPFSNDLRRALENALEGQILATGMNIPLAPEEAEGRKLSPRFFADNKGGRQATRSDDDDEGFEEALPPPRPMARPRDARHASPEFGKRLAYAAAFISAVLLTSALLYGSVVASGYLTQMFANQPLPSVDNVRALPDDLRTMMSEANEKLVAGRADEAVSLLRRASESHPEHADALKPSHHQALRALAASELRRGNHAGAVEAYREATTVDTQNALNWIDLGRALRDLAGSGGMSQQVARQREILAEAEQAFQRALTLSPNDSSALLGLAQVYNARNSRQQAVETYEKLVAIAPGSSEGRMAERALRQLRQR